LSFGAKIGVAPAHYLFNQTKKRQLMIIRFMRFVLLMLHQLVTKNQLPNTKFIYIRTLIFVLIEIQRKKRPGNPFFFGIATVKIKK
jgi:hypothetical protein